MINAQQIKERLKGPFEEQQAGVLAEVIVEATHESQKELVKASDFNELKDIVKGLGIKVGELAEAQKRTELKVEELAEAQKRTEIEIRTLVKVVDKTSTDLGGLSRSVGYALENEAYRALPGYLKNFGVELTEKFIRTIIDDEEINILGRGRKNGQEIIIVGEAELKLTSVGKLKEFERKVNTLRKKYPTKEIFKIFVTHFARPEIIEKAREKGITIVQSFEWI
jgi:hypothetical protein